MRQKRNFAPGQIYHVYNRGHNKQKIFFDRQDYGYYINKVGEYARTSGVSTLMYCLMPNHLHLCIKQISEVPPSKFLQKLNMSYAEYFNHKYGVVGHLFQSRYQCVLVEGDEYLTYLAGYIHTNPRQLVRSLEQYKYSSLREYLRLDRTNICDGKNIILELFASNEKSLWRYVMDFKKHDQQ